MGLNGSALLSAILLAVLAGMTIVAATYPPEARLMPLVIGIPATLCCAAQLIMEFAASRRTRRRHGLADRFTAARREMILLGWFTAGVLGIVLFGFLCAGPVLVFAFLYFDQQESVTLAGAAAGGFLAGLYIVFEMALKLSLFRGFIGDWLFG